MGLINFIWKDWQEKRKLNRYKETFKEVVLEAVKESKKTGKKGIAYFQDSILLDIPKKKKNNVWKVLQDLYPNFESSSNFKLYLKETQMNNVAISVISLKEMKNNLVIEFEAECSGTAYFSKSDVKEAKDLFTKKMKQLIKKV